MLFIGTQFINLYTTVDTPAKGSMGAIYGDFSRLRSCVVQPAASTDVCQNCMSAPQNVDARTL